MSVAPRILLIDDDRAWSETLADYLSTKGFTVETAHEGARGLELICTAAASLALLDYHMPDMDGLEVLRRLRQHPGRSVPIMFMSSDDESELPARALAEGAKAFLSKSTPPAFLLGAIRRALETDARQVHLPVVWRRFGDGDKDSFVQRSSHTLG